MRFSDALLDINDEIGKLAGIYLRNFNKSHNVEIADALIAGTALFNKVPLFTFNRKHYPMNDIEFFLQPDHRKPNR